MPTPTTTTSAAATAAIGTAGTSRTPRKNAPNASPRRLGAGRLVCIRSQSSSSKSGRGRVVSMASPVRAEMIERRVARDPKQPRRRRGVAGLETRVGLVGVHEDLGRDVLGVRGRADLRPDVGVDATEVFPVEVFERRPVGEQGRFMVLGCTTELANARPAGAVTRLLAKGGANLPRPVAEDGVRLAVLAPLHRRVGVD